MRKWFRKLFWTPKTTTGKYCLTLAFEIDPYLVDYLNKYDPQLWDLTIAGVNERDLCNIKYRGHTLPYKGVVITTRKGTF